MFLLSLKAGGTGLTLTRATHVLHYDRWWNPAVEDQATDRAYRIGQDRPVQVHRLIAEGTLEDRIACPAGEETRARRRCDRLRRGLDRRAVRRRAHRAVSACEPRDERGTRARARAWLRATPGGAGPGWRRWSSGPSSTRTGCPAAGTTPAPGRSADLTLAPGEARAQVQGRKSEPYEVRIRVRRFTDDEWDRVLDAISARLGHAAALLDGELPPEIADDVAAAGLDLLPGGGEIGPRCSCPDDADPCKHAAAVCYLVADALDADPFAGSAAARPDPRARCWLACGCGAAAWISSRRRRPDPRRRPADRPATQRPAAPMQTAQRRTRLPAIGAWMPAPFCAAAPPSGPIPVPPLPPERPGHPAALPVDPPPWRSGLRDDLLALASDAARRAWELATGLTADAGLSLDADADLARRADRALGTLGLRRAGRALRGRAGTSWPAAALAWRHGGPGGLELLHAEWDPDTDAVDAADAADLLKAARVALRDASGTTASIARNRVTAGRTQLRLGRDLLWYPYSRSDDDWEPAGPPQSDPARAADSL